MTLALLGRRAADATICPSEVARAMALTTGRDDWRSEMTRVHGAVARLAAEGLVHLTWKGLARTVDDGPYRIGRAHGRDPVEADALKSANGSYIDLEGSPR